MEQIITSNYHGAEIGEKLLIEFNGCAFIGIAIDKSRINLIKFLYFLA